MRSFRPYHRPIQQLALRLGQPRRTRRRFHREDPRIMSTQREDSIPHELRTAAEPRQNRLYPVRLSHVEQVNPSVRLLQLAIPSEGDNDTQQPFSFLPGQWLDVHIPSISQAGGFTITSTPADAQLLPSLEPPAGPMAGSEETGISTSIISESRAPYVELAVQKSPANPPAAWLWKPKDDILGKEINIRVGGSFVWPPTGVDLHELRNVIFIAGGVGINRLPNGVEKSSKEANLEQILFLSRLRNIVRAQSQSKKLRISLHLFLTNLNSSQPESTRDPADLAIHPRRINEDDLRSSITGTDGHMKTVAYICGPPHMTDEMIDRLKVILDDRDERRIFYEKWW